MRLTTVILIASLMQASSATFGQRITLNQRNITLDSVLKEIRRQSGFDFYYDRKAIPKTQKVNVSVANATIDEALRHILSGLKLTFKIDGKTVGIKTSEPTFMDNVVHRFNVIDVSGVVKDEKGKGIPGVMVVVKGTVIRAVTDNQGRFKLNANSSNDILVFSYIGLETREVSIRDKTQLEIIMKESIQNLNETVVIGYGTSTKGDLVGSVGTVNTADIEKAPVGSFTEALAGRVAGVQVAAADGQPGAVSSIVIRGASSLTQSNAPLYVIDGFASENPESSALNTDDIESISILKDATATAIYGSRAANGVIVITTKKGKIGAPIITINSSYGLQGGIKTIETMSPYEFVKYQVELGEVLNLPAAGAARYLVNGKTLDYYKDTEGINWQNELFRQGVTQIHNVALRGGNQQTRYSISGSVFNQKGVVINTGYTKYQGRFSIDQTVTKQFTVGLNLNYAFQHTNGTMVASNPASSTSQISAILLFRAWGYRPVSGNTDFDLINAPADTENYGSVGEPLRILNPLTSTQNEYQHTKNRDMIGNIYLKYDFNKSLSLKVTGSMNPRIMRRDQFYNSQTPQGSPLNLANVKGISGGVNYYENNVFENVNTLSYSTLIDKNHTVNAVLGFSLAKSSSEQYGYQAQNLPNEILGIAGLNEGIANNQLAYESSNGLASYFGRLSYNYRSKYYLEGNIRADGSSKFYKDNRWGYFPSIGASWRMDKENFLENLQFVSNAKLRASYGLIGNNRISDFAYLASLTSGILTGVSFNNATPGTGVIPASLSNQDLKWETTQTLNLGYDIGLFKNRVAFTVEWYKKVTKDLLLNALLPATTGFPSAIKNIGSVQNTGVEISLNTTNVDNKNFRWSSSFNISFNKNKILELTRGQRTLYSNATAFETGFSNPLYISEIGQPAGQFYGYIWDGNYQYTDFNNPAPGVYILKNEVPTNGGIRGNIKPGDIKYKDINGDGAVNTFDLSVIGRGQPVHYGGFANNFSYKGFDLNLFLQWSYGNDIYNANRVVLEGNSNQRLDFNQFASYQNRWTPDNPTNENFRTGGGGPVGYFSTKQLENGSYLRLKTVSFGYSFPKKFLGKTRMSSLRLNVSAQNLLTITNYSGMDPEVNTRGTVLTPGFDWSSYPNAKTLVFGLNAAF